MSAPFPTAAAALQQAATALVALLDTAPAIVALTGRASDNVVQGDTVGPVHRRGLAFVLEQPEERDGVGWQWDLELGLLAEAESPSVCLALLAAAEQALTVPAFAAIGVDAMVTRFAPAPVARGQPPDAARPLETCAAEADVAVWLTLPG